MAPRDKKGKKISPSTPAWSDWVWDDRGYYYRSRYNSSGQLDYEYDYPTSQTTQPLHATESFSSTSGPSIITTPYYSSAGSSSNAGTLEPATIPSYTTDVTVPRAAAVSGYATSPTTAVTSDYYPQSSASVPASVTTDEATFQSARPNSSGSNTGSERTLKPLTTSSNISTQNYGRPASPAHLASSMQNLAITSGSLYGESSSTAGTTSPYFNYTTSPPLTLPNQGTGNCMTPHVKGYH